MGLIIPSIPQWAAEPGFASVSTIQVSPIQDASWYEGAILINKTVGTVTMPNPNGSLSTLAGPVASVITISYSASAGKPAQSLFGAVSYLGAASIESQLSDPFVVNVPAGNVATITVSAVGAPAAATSFNVYLGTVPTNFCLQNSGGTALGSTFTAAYPLTNSFGVGEAATGVSSGIIGIADCDSDRYFAGYPAGSFQTGTRQPFGASQAMAPGWPNDAFQVPVTKCQIGYFVMNLLQPWYEGLAGTTAGVALDTGSTFTTNGTGLWIVDTAQTACLTIIRRATQNAYEQSGDVGARVIVKFTPSALA